MTSIGQRTLDVVNMFNAGVPILEIAEKLDMTPSSVEKRLRSYKRFKAGGWAHQRNLQDPVWTTERIKDGFDKFLAENGRLPTAYEIDDSPYLPSSRQLQRRFGGLAVLREALGYGNVDFSSGDNRRSIVRVVGERGADAEDKLEAILVERFGALFVHSECRFGGTRKRVDFVVYARDQAVAIDVFATNDARTLVKNIDVKLPKYEVFPATTPLFFLVWSDTIKQAEIDGMIARSAKLSARPNLHIVDLQTMMNYLEKLESLTPPDGYRPL